MAITSRERLKTVIAGKIPDCVPVAPDFSVMIPARLTGKPYWDLSLYQDPPGWDAYIDCAKYFNIDSLMDGYAPLVFDDERDLEQEARQERFIVQRTEDRIIVQTRWDKKNWANTVDVHFRNQPATSGISLDKVGLPQEPVRYEPIEGVKPIDISPKGFAKAKKRLGDQGLCGAWLTTSIAFSNEEQIVWYCMNPDKHEEMAQQRIVDVEKRFARLMSMEEKPDFLSVGGSGTLVFQTVEMFRKVAFPAVKRGIELATAAGIPTHIHSCGRQRELVQIMAEETTLSVIDPLEIPPMGNCDLADLKKNWGKKLVLKGNLHTTDVMLQGSVDTVIAASKRAIDDAAEGGRFILSTGDQCGRDTPFENLRAMIETARTYGKY